MEAQTTPTKAEIIAAMRAHIGQRSGIDFRNYGDRDSFMGDYRPMLREGREARKMLRFVELRDSITADNILAACKQAFSGRLTYNAAKKRFDYCTGQYFATEYRAAACAVLASVIWDYFRDSYPTRDRIEKEVRGYLGRGIVSRWF
jgi:hypothetical protein